MLLDDGRQTEQSSRHQRPAAGGAPVELCLLSAGCSGASLLEGTCGGVQVLSSWTVPVFCRRIVLRSLQILSSRPSLTAAGRTVAEARSVLLRWHIFFLRGFIFVVFCFTAWLLIAKANIPENKSIFFLYFWQDLVAQMQSSVFFYYENLLSLPSTLCWFYHKMRLHHSLPGKHSHLDFVDWVLNNK